MTNSEPICPAPDSPFELELTGRLDLDFVDRLWLAPRGAILIRIASDGGNAACARHIACDIEHAKHFQCHISHAESAAAIVALACYRREMAADGVLRLHLGNIEVQGRHLLEGDCWERQALDFVDFVQWQLGWLEGRFPLLAAAPEMAGLKETNWAAIDAPRAMELGLIHAIA